MTCIFCNQIQPEAILKQTENFKLVYDIDPIQNGHILLMANEHVSDLRELTATQILELYSIQKEILTIFDSLPNIIGGSIIQNNGRTMDEGTHFHVHIVPRFENDEFWNGQSVLPRNIDLNILNNLLNRLSI